MERSGNGRFLTTHTGSLPRPPALLELLMARETGQPYDTTLFDRTVRDEVDTVVHDQADAGIQVVNDGEQGKATFVNYRLHRLSGFELVDTASLPPGSGFGMAEADDFPEFYAHMWQWGPSGDRDAPPPPRPSAAPARSAGRTSPTWSATSATSVRQPTTSRWQRSS